MKPATAFFFGLGLVAAPHLRAQDTPPSTDIFLADLKGSRGELRLGTPVNVTDREGYDNQPSFSPDGGSIYYTSLGDDGQTDIWRYDIAKRSRVRVRQTPESEYSPTVMPGGHSLSVIRVEADKTQRLWQLPLGKGEPSVLLKDIKPVGYHVWADDTTLVLFVLGTPPTLQIASTRDGQATVVLDNPGRSFHRIPGRKTVSFVHKVSEKEWWIKELDVATREVKPLVRTLDGSEDYAWTPDGTLVMGQGPALFSCQPGKGAAWKEIARFASEALAKITRVSVSPKGDRLAFVSDRPKAKP